MPASPSWRSLRRRATCRAPSRSPRWRGWDTDCNAGNAGAIVGTFQGLQPGWDKYRKPINDFVVASGVLGTVNVVDIPSFARELTVARAAAPRRRDAEPLWAEDFERRGVRFDFDAPGATHGFRTEPFNQISLKGSSERPGPRLARLARNPARPAGARAGRPRLLEALLPARRLRRRALPPDVHAARRRRADGELQALARPVERRRQSPRRALRAPRDVAARSRRPAPGTSPRPRAGRTMSSRSPRAPRRSTRSASSSSISAGSNSSAGCSSPTSRSAGPGRVTIDPKIESAGVGRHHPLHLEPRPLDASQNGVIHAHTAEDADAWTGNAYLRDVTVTADLTPLAGSSHLVVGARAGNVAVLRGGLRWRRRRHRQGGPRHDRAGPRAVRAACLTAPIGLN